MWQVVSSFGLFVVVASNAQRGGSLVSGWAEEDEEALLLADDDCWSTNPGEGAFCALSGLQVRAQISQPSSLSPSVLGDERMSERSFGLASGSSTRPPSSSVASASASASASDSSTSYSAPFPPPPPASVIFPRRAPALAEVSRVDVAPEGAGDSMAEHSQPNTVATYPGAELRMPPSPVPARAPVPAAAPPPAPLPAPPEASPPPPFSPGALAEASSTPTLSPAAEMPPSSSPPSTVQLVDHTSTKRIEGVAAFLSPSKASMLLNLFSMSDEGREGDLPTKSVSSSSGTLPRSQPHPHSKGAWVPWAILLAFMMATALFCIGVVVAATSMRTGMRENTNRVVLAPPEDPAFVEAQHVMEDADRYARAHISSGRPGPPFRAIHRAQQEANMEAQQRLLSMGRSGDQGGYLPTGSRQPTFESQGRAVTADTIARIQESQAVDRAQRQLRHSQPRSNFLPFGRHSISRNDRTERKDCC